ncbi:MAG: sulfatase [Pirellulales bacterium]|nr:sulfatase [Pirellulales bacterium]
MRRNFLSMLFAAAVVSLDCGFASSADSGRRPNIVFILADDLGWRDTSLYGSTFYETPQIDRLARRGMRFCNAYAASPLCSPTRASIMTGLTPERIGITYPLCHIAEERLKAALAPQTPDDRKAIPCQTATRLSTDYYTLAEAFRDAGYATGHFGKWHLGAEPYSALEHGFAVDVPHTPACEPESGYLGPWKFLEKQHFTGVANEHLEDRMASEAIGFLRANRDKPFFLNYWAFSVHSPFDAKPEFVAKYRRKANPNHPQQCPIYAAMVQSLDDNVGRLLDALDEFHLTEHTIVIFFSDNGGNMYERADGLLPTSNAPLRDGKGTLYEGGVRVPLLVVWPGRVQPDSQSEAFFSSVDFYPTLLEMAGLKAKSGQTFDGVSQAPVLQGQAAVREAVYGCFPQYFPSAKSLPSSSVRVGDWKLIRFHCDNADQTDRFELYNLREDLGESKNLAAEFPQKVQTLDALLGRHLREIGAIVPQPNPGYRKTKE